MKADTVTLVGRPHPLRSESYTCELKPGTTLAEFLPDAPDTVYAQVNGEPWPRERWGEPLPAGLVNLYAVPHGDNALRSIAMIAVAVAAAATGQWAVAAAGVEGLAATATYAAASAAVAAPGSLALNLECYP